MLTTNFKTITTFGLAMSLSALAFAEPENIPAAAAEAAAVAKEGSQEDFFDAILSPVLFSLQEARVALAAAESRNGSDKPLLRADPGTPIRTGGNFLIHLGEPEMPGMKVKIIEQAE